MGHSKHIGQSTRNTGDEQFGLALCQWEQGPSGQAAHDQHWHCMHCYAEMQSLGLGLTNVGERREDLSNVAKDPLRSYKNEMRLSLPGSNWNIHTLLLSNNNLRLVIRADIENKGGNCSENVSHTPLLPQSPPKRRRDFAWVTQMHEICSWP